MHEIILQVAQTDIEDSDIRNEAIEAIVDMATVYETRYKDDHQITLFLLRLQEGAEPALLRIGAECSAKLLFNGRLSDPKLFSNLLKFFFLPQLAGEKAEGDEDDDVTVDDAYLGSLPRLQQILSIFFQVFFKGGPSWEAIAFQCVSDLVADLSMLIRDGALDPTAMTMVRCVYLYFIRYFFLSLYYFSSYVHFIILCVIFLLCLSSNMYIIHFSYFYFLP